MEVSRGFMDFIYELFIFQPATFDYQRVYDMALALQNFPELSFALSWDMSRNLQGKISWIFAENHWLVVEPYPSEKYEFVNWDDDIPNIWKIYENIIFMFQSLTRSNIIKQHQISSTTEVCLMFHELCPWEWESMGPRQPPERDQAFFIRDLRPQGQKVRRWKNGI